MSLAIVALAVMIAAAAILVRWLRGRWLSVTVRGSSMAPTFRDGQRLVVRRSRAGAALRCGDVIVFALTADQIASEKTEAIPYRVKRVAAVAGDPVPDWLRPLATDARVPPGHVVVSGDNPRSQDSRHLGYIDARSIVAVVPAPPPPAG